MDSLGRLDARVIVVTPVTRDLVVMLALQVHQSAPLRSMDLRVSGVSGVTMDCLDSMDDQGWMALPVLPDPREITALLAYLEPQVSPSRASLENQVLLGWKVCVEEKAYLVFRG
jgi:hypothetical protein